MTTDGKRMIGYARVSAIAGRSGDSFQSPDQQAHAIREWAKLNGVELLDVVVELDKSAGRGKQRPKFDEALMRCQAGEADGIVVAYVSRFGRSVTEALNRVEMLNDAGARVVSISEGVDSASATGRLVLGIMLSLAEFERERIRDQWAESQADAQSRGVHLGPTPIGYMRKGAPSKRTGRPTGPLYVDPEAAAVVREAFERRARGEGIRAIARYMTDVGHPLAERGVPKMLKSRVYLGEAHAPVTNTWHPGAHEAIVDRDLWQRCQWSDGPIEQRRGSMVKTVALVGARCAGCGNVMSVARGGSGLPVWRCQNFNCTARGSIAAHRLDQFVQDELDAAIRDNATVEDLLIDDAHFSELVEAVDRARADRDKLLDSVAYGGLSAADAAALLKATSERVATAERARNAVRPPVAPLEGGYTSGGEDLTLAKQRAQFARLIGSVSVGKAASRSQPISERVTVELAG